MEPSNALPAEAGDQLDQLRRAGLLAHTRYPKLGPWYPPAAGVFAAVWVAGFAMPTWLQLLVWFVLLTLVGASLGAYQRMRGTQPDPRQSPRQIKREMLGFGVGFAALAGGLVVLWSSTNWWITALAAAVSVTAGVAVYERRYAAAAHRAELDGGVADASA